LTRKAEFGGRNPRLQGRIDSPRVIGPATKNVRPCCWIGNELALQWWPVISRAAVNERKEHHKGIEIATSATPPYTAPLTGEAVSSPYSEVRRCAQGSPTAFLVPPMVLQCPQFQFGHPNRGRIAEPCPAIADWAFSWSRGV